MIWLDFETRSCCDLETRGLDNYAKDPSTEVLLCAYAFDDHAVKLWQPHLTPQIPNDLQEALESPFTQCWAWNAAFEHAIINHVLKVPKPIEEFRDPMANARYLSLPGSLTDAGAILGLKETAKMTEGDRLIKLFCEPEDEGGEETLWGRSLPTFRDWTTDPRDWALFGDYCKQDVVAERAAMKKMRKFALPEHEWDTWFLSERINQRGIPTDSVLIAGARAIVNKEIEKLLLQLRQTTELENPASVTQLLPWLQDRGYTFSSLGKAFVARAMGGECELTEEARVVLEIRGQTAKSSVKKYTAIADTTSEDGWLRYAYQYMGAARTGRFCIAEGSLVTVKTSEGVVIEKPIETVCLTDFVWDGTEWVSHEGVVCNGEKEVISWNGITATKDHFVWLSPTEKTTLGVAAQNYQQLWKGQPEYEIYKLTSPSGKSYFGLTNMGVAERWKKHIWRAFNENRNHPLYNAIRKYGADAFVIQVVDFALNKTRARKLETEYIAGHPKDLLYNLSPGGEADGETGARIFWERIRQDPEWLEQYKQQLSQTKKDNPDSTAHLPAEAEKWKREHPREAYYMVRRAARMSPTWKTAAPDTRPLIERLRWKWNRPEACRIMKQEWWDNAPEERREEIAQNVSKGKKLEWENKTPEEKQEMIQRLDQMRDSMDRTIQGPAASRGLKKFWEELRKDPEKYNAYIEQRKKTFKETAEAKKRKCEPMTSLMPVLETASCVTG